MTHCRSRAPRCSAPQPACIPVSLSDVQNMCSAALLHCRQHNEWKAFTHACPGHTSTRRPVIYNSILRSCMNMLPARLTSVIACWSSVRGAPLSALRHAAPLLMLPPADLLQRLAAAAVAPQLGAPTLGAPTHRQPLQLQLRPSCGPASRPSCGLHVKSGCCPLRPLPPGGRRRPYFSVHIGQAFGASTSTSLYWIPCALPCKLQLLTRHQDSSSMEPQAAHAHCCRCVQDMPQVHDVCAGSGAGGGCSIKSTRKEDQGHM